MKKNYNQPNVEVFDWRLEGNLMAGSPHIGGTMEVSSTTISGGGD